MRRPVSGILVLFLLFALLFVQKASVPLVNGSSSVYQGDLILAGNNVTVIEGRFDINGSIVVQDNATLILKNAFLNFTQIEDYQHYIWLNYPSNGNPRLLAYNSTITSTSDYALHIFCEANSTVTINNCTCTCCNFWAAEYSVLSISHSYVLILQQYWFSIANISESTIRWFDNYDYSETKIYDSEIDSLLLRPESVNGTISQLKPGLFSYWSFINNCSITVQSGGSAPNVTLTNTSVNKWRFNFYGSSNATILNSAIESVTGGGSSVISLKSTTIYRVVPEDSSICLTNDSLITYVNAYASSNVWLLNSTYTGAYTQQSSKVYVSWYLNVHVKNSVDQNVPSASVTVTFPNATVADSKLTDANGLARFPLMEKMMNATGQYPIGNYTVKAEYGTYSSSTKANMTGNQEVTIQLPFGAPSPTPSPSPSPSPSSSPTPSPAPTPTPSSSPSPTTAPTPTPEPKPSLFLPIEALFGIGAIITIAIILIVFILLRKRKLD